MDASADGNAVGEGDGATDPALGPPEKMAEHRAELTPMTAQYFDLCEQYDESLVLFQVGDFYEAFCEAAETIARILEITLTKREDSTGEWPMAGIPIDSAESYIETLLESGYRVAVADQVEDPDETTGLVDRAVTRIVTPGTLTEDELLRTTDNNYVACLTEGADEYGLALLDVSTGDFYTTSAESLPAIADEVGRFEPAEAIVGPEAPADPFDADCMVTPYERRAFDAERAREKVADYFGPPETLLAGESEVRACGALLAYAEYARAGQDGRLEYLNHLTRYDPREYMLLDAVALRSLELFERRAVHGAEGAALVDVVDATSSALGSRKLKDWLRRPLVEQADIEARHDAVEELRGALRTREQAASLLREVYDIERLISRVSRGRADARDLRALKATLDVVPRLRGVLQDVESEALTDVRAGLDDLPEVRDLIGRAIREDPPAELTEGDLIKEGYNDELDELRATERSGKEWIDSLERQERERTGIDSLKVGHNSVHGYYIEVTNPNIEKVPDDYQRRQTLKNSERFYIPELKEREEEIFRAEQRADDLELELFREVREAVAAEAERVQALAETLATLDALVAFGDVAAKHGYTRPAMGAEGFAIEGGRHPVVERTEENFVPNDTRLAADERVAIITGPNMAGKSTYMRQVALVSILAQAGSFVPAEAASLPVVDRVFTRVGASDDIAGGRSTFMVEMAELSDILQNATEDSLVLLDEVGRGTSTADGLAIARAVTEYVHDEVRATTLFATHHHELTETASELPEAVNLNFDAEEVGDEVTFSHEVSRGAATASYGIEVAKTAGVPDAVIDRARELLGDAAINDDSGQSSASEDPETESETRSLEEFTEGSDADADAGELPPAVAERLREVNLARTTPIEALTLLNELQDELRE